MKISTVSKSIAAISFTFFTSLAVYGSQSDYTYIGDSYNPNTTENETIGDCKIVISKQGHDLVNIKVEGQGLAYNMNLGESEEIVNIDLSQTEEGFKARKSFKEFWVTRGKSKKIIGRSVLKVPKPEFHERLVKGIKKIELIINEDQTEISSLEASDKTVLGFSGMLSPLNTKLACKNLKLNTP